MRTWVLLLFCVAVIAAIANAQKQSNGGKKVDRETGKEEVEGKDERRGGKKNQLKIDGNGNKHQPTGKNKPEKAKNRNEPKDGKGSRKHRERQIKKNSGREPKNNRPNNGEKVPRKKSRKNTQKGEEKVPRKKARKNTQNGEEKVPRKKHRNGRGRKKSLKKKERKSGYKEKDTKPKRDCPGECVAPSDCKGRRRKGMMCDDDQICCLPKRKRAGKKATTVKRFCKPLSLCSEKKGECRKQKKGCNLDEKRYKNKKNKTYCDKKSCICCVKQCSARKKCLKEGGTCMLKKTAKKLCTDGEFVMAKKYCNGKKCGCCIPGGSSCKQKKTCTKEGGSCVTLGSSCSTEIKTKNPKGKNYCKGSCGCCLPVPPTDAPSVPPTQPVTTASSSCSVTRAYCPDCGIAQVDVDGIRIVNGTTAAENEYPYQVVVSIAFSLGNSTCGGSIIKKRWILSAAHCFFDENGDQVSLDAISVGYGSSDRKSLTFVNANRYILHENYKRQSKDYDIALIELPSDLNYEEDDRIQPICLAEESDITVGGKAVVTGWGTLSFGGDVTDDLQEVALDIISNAQCQNLNQDKSSVVCALTPYKDSCQGDSGGPLVVQVCPNRWAQIGIVSYGDGCANPGKPGIYTRVPAFRNWIDKNTGSPTTC